MGVMFSNRSYFLILVLVLVSFGLNSFSGCRKEKNIVDISGGCTFSGIKSEGDIDIGDPDQEVEDVISSILQTIGIPKGFNVHKGDVQGIIAVKNEDKRYIIYDEAYLNEIRRGNNGYWVERGIFAHMIAHHISNHGLTVEPGRSLTELEADKFVGMTLQKMGATSVEVIEALNMVRNIMAEDYYPENISRISATESGWNQSGGAIQQAQRFSERAYDGGGVPTTSSTLSRGEIAGFLSRWTQSQSNYNFSDYADCYSFGFQGMKMNKKGRRAYFDYYGWLNDRQAIYNHATNLSVRASEIRIISRDDWGTTIQFVQDYYSDSYQDRGEKLMKLHKDENGAIRIVYEEMLSSY
jgi:hypothetical protein